MTERLEDDRPGLRGPRPLPAHLMAAAGQGLGALAALRQGAAAGGLWHPSLRAEAAALLTEIAHLGAGRVAGALAAESEARLKQFMEGVSAYQGHAYQRRLDAPPVLAAEGGVRLLDYGGAGPAVLFAPSLINPAWVLDLRRERSLMRYLAAAGLRPLLLDWGRPAGEELGFNVDDYITRRLCPLLDRAVAAAGGPVALAGYCMGGDLALAAACLKPAAVSRLALLATPWDFHAAGPAQPAMVTALAQACAPVMAAEGVLPVDCLQLFFAMLDPILVERKFRRFAAFEMDSPAAADFVALEDWANRGPPLAAPAARQCFDAWYRDNDPAAGRWRIGGAPIDPAAIGCPIMVMIAGRDRIVPPASSRALARALPGPEVRELSAGHVGMIVGRQAETQTWRPLQAWLAAL